MLSASGKAKPPTRPEYWLKRSITLDPIVGSCSNFYRSFWRLFSLACNEIATRQWLRLVELEHQPHQSIGSKGPPLDHHQSFIGVSRGCFLRIANKSLLDANNIFSGTPTTSFQAKWSTRPKYQVKRSITLDLTVGLCSNLYKCF